MFQGILSCVQGFLEFGDFRPFRVSRDVQDLFEVQANRLGVPNAFESAIDTN